MVTSTLVKKLSLAAAGAAVMALGAGGAAEAASLTTTFAGGNGQAGNMFDVTTFGNSLTVTSLDINVRRFDGEGILNVYKKLGSYVGSETNPADWTLVSSTPLTSVSPTGTPTFVDVVDFLLEASSVTGLYVTFAGQVGFPTDALEYTDGSNTYANADLRLDSGVGKADTFGNTFSPRTWNGTINYEVNTASVPEPASVLGLLAVGALGAGSALKRKQGQKA